MTRDPASDVLFPAKRPDPAGRSSEPRIVSLSEYCTLLLAHRSIDRVGHGTPPGFQGLRDPRTGQTWLIREDVLVHAS